VIDSAHGRLLADLSTDEAARRLTESSIVILPLGAVEHHGPHLPLSTDLVIVDEVASAVVTEFGDDLDLWLLPPLPFTKSNEHAWAAGTVWLSPETMLAILRDIGRALAALPVRRLVFLNGHGGNTSLLDVVCRELRLEHGFMTFLLHPSLPPDHGGDGSPLECGLGIHGGAGETSMLLYLRPDLVRLDLAVDNVPTWMNDNEHVSFAGSAGFGWLSTDFGPTGVIGNATLATPEMGKQIVEDCVAALGATLAEIARFEFPDSVTQGRR
jgi:creatinine amidohydrolase